MSDNEFVGVNERKGLPRSYRFNPFLRWFTMIMAALAFAYSIYVLVEGRISADASTLMKAVPFLIMFLALNTILKNLLSLNSIRFEPQQIAFRCIVRPAVRFQWSDLRRMEFVDGRIRYIRLMYSHDGEEKKYDFSINFPNMLEIVNAIDEMAPHIEVDEFLGNVLVRRKHQPRPVKVTPPQGE